MLIRYGKEKDGKLIKKAVVYTREEHKINFADVDNDAVFITGKLRANGYECYIVGGAVRDLILGKKPKDFDLVTDATPARIKRVFRNSRIIGRRFRLVHVYFGEKIFEVSTFRSLIDGHTSNTYGTLEEDVQRRDFSFNALLYDPGKQLVVDYVNGMADIQKRVLRPIIPLQLIFKDDPVRMIRAVKYAAAGGFAIPALLRRRIKKEAVLLESVSPSRLTEELAKIIRSPAAAQIVESLEDAGIFGFLQKEASGLLKRDNVFRKAYLAGFAELALNDPPAKGQPMAALIRTYLEMHTPWQELKQVIPGSWDRYKAVFYDTRRFIAPMNPPKIELEQALRLVFAEHGIDLKKARSMERERHLEKARRAHQTHIAGNAAAPQAKPAKSADAPKPRRKRRPAEKKSINTFPT